MLNIYLKKCGLSNNSNKGGDSLINIKRIEVYKTLLPENELKMIEETNSEDVDGVDDEFEGSSSEAGSDSE